MNETKRVAITTSTFAQFSNKPIQLLKDHGFDIVKNDFGRKLDVNETKIIINHRTQSQKEYYNEYFNK